MAWATANAAGIILVGRNNELLEKAATSAKEANPAVKISIQTADITSEESVQELYASIKEDFADVHVLINASGTMDAGLLKDVKPAQWWLDFVSVSYLR